MNRSPWVYAVFIMLLLFGMTGISRAAVSTADELYRSGQQAYLDFDNERAVELLMKALERDPDHKKSRALLEEMGRDVPPPSHFKKTDRESNEADTVADTQAEQDTGTKVPSDGVDDGTSPADGPGPNAVTSDPAEEIQLDTPTLQAAKDTSSTGRDFSRPDTPDADPKIAQSELAESRGGDTPGSTEETPINRRVSGETSPAEDQAISVPESPTNPTASVPPPPVVPGPVGSDYSKKTDSSGSSSGERKLIAPDLTPSTGRGTASREGESGQILPTLRSTSSETSEASLNETGNMDSRETTYRPNINSIDVSRLREEFDPDLARRIIEERRDRGFYLSWTEFRERISPGRRQFESIRQSFTLAIPVVNINTASADRLSSLPYMTADIADNIVNFRFTYGDYTSVDQLLDVPGMTESALERVKPYLEAR